MMLDHIPVALFKEDWCAVKQAVDQMTASGSSDLCDYLADHPEWLQDLYERRKIIDVNLAAVRLYEAQDKDTLMKASDRIAPPADLSVFRQMVTAMARGQQHFECNAGHLTLNGQPLFIILSLNFPPAPAAYDQIVISATNITHQKNLETQLLHAQKMESIGTMAAGLAHDFNNLLMGIMGNVSLVMDMIDESHPAYNRLQNIDSYVQRGADLAHQLLSFAKGEQRRTRPTNLNRLIANNAQIFARTNKGIAVHTRLADNLWATEVDRGQIDQVLYNLYLNALQAMENLGDLFVETQNVTLAPKEIAAHGAAPGRYVEICVRDTGRGMDEQTLPRIFDPFYSTKERGRGTGLGLTAAYGIVKNHAGFITVQSSPGEGATFSLYLPATDKQAAHTTPQSRKPLTNGAGTILLVDDEEMITEVVGSMIRKLGYTVILAQSGREAIRAFQDRHHTIDLVILDMIMPEMDGCQTYFELKEIDPDVKVLLCSGFSVEGKTETALQQGCIGFMQKPLSINALSEKINSVCRAAETSTQQQ